MNNSDNNNGQFPNYPNGNNNNGQFPNYPNNYSYNTWNSPNNDYQNGPGYNQPPHQGEAIVKECKSLGIAYLSLFGIALVLSIIGGLTYFWAVFITIGVVIIVFEILNIVLIVKTFKLKDAIKGVNSLWVLFLIGIFIPFISFVAAIMTVTSCDSRKQN